MCDLHDGDLFQFEMNESRGSFSYLCFLLILQPYVSFKVCIVNVCKYSTVTTKYPTHFFTNHDKRPNKGGIKKVIKNKSILNQTVAVY